MPRNPSRQTASVQDWKSASGESVVERGASLFDLVDEALAQVIDACDSDQARNTCYSYAFPVGEAIGRILRKRCLESDGPRGLAMIIERMFDAQLAEVSVEAAARRALFSGFCWELERALRDGIPESTTAADEHAMLLDGLRRGRNAVVTDTASDTDATNLHD